MELCVDTSLVHRTQHPLNAGCSPQSPPIGIDSKMYSPYDRASIIVESMSLFRLRSRSHFNPSAKDQASAKRKREDEEKSQLPLTLLQIMEEDDQEEKKARQEDNKDDLCPCARANPNLLVESNDSDCLVCSECGLCTRGTITKALHREKACAADEDKTQHADVPQEVSDRFANPSSNLQVARQLKSNGEPSRCTLPRDRKKVGFAVETVARLAERGAQMRNSMTAKDQTRELQLLVRLEKLFQHLEPAPDALKRYMRVESYSFFHAYIDHCSKCESAHCRFSGLRGKSLQYLANTCMAATIEQLSDGSCTVEVQPEQLEAIIERHGENVPAGTRTAVRELRLFLNAAHKETEMPVCAAGSQTVAVELAAEDEKKRVAEEESEKEGGAFGRQLRVFVRKLHFVEGHDLVEHTMQFYIGKYETIQASVEASDLSWPARAFAAMEIAARAKEGLGLREHSSRMRPALLASLGATSVAVMELVQELYDRLNTGSSADHACA